MSTSFFLISLPVSGLFILVFFSLSFSAFFPTPPNSAHFEPFPSSNAWTQTQRQSQLVAHSSLCCNIVNTFDLFISLLWTRERQTLSELLWNNCGVPLDAEVGSFVFRVVWVGYWKHFILSSTNVWHAISGFSTNKDHHNVSNMQIKNLEVIGVKIVQHDLTFN